MTFAATTRLLAFAVLSLQVLIAMPSGARAQDADFSGDWQTFWRTGAAVLSLRQEGDRVTGTYQPDDGVVEGAVRGRLLTGTWSQAGGEGGEFLFALSEDGRVLTGRFGNGEWWNGVRDDEAFARGLAGLTGESPRAALRSVLIIANFAIHAGNARTMRLIDRLLAYDGPASSAGDRARRRTLLFDILDMSTLRVMDVPEAPDAAEARFAIGPAATPEKTELVFRRGAAGAWRLVVPTETALAAERARLLAAMGHADMGDLNIARANTPRTAMRDLVLGVRSWNEGGRGRALGALDLSEIPERLHALEGPIYADYLRRIIDLIGFVIWQEIPDDPDRSVPYVWFQHPFGNITLTRVPQAAEDGAAPLPDRWKVSARSLAAAPALFEAMQDLPPMANLPEPEALSPFFELREAVRGVAPELVAKWGWLEAWQWLGLAAAVVLAALAAAALRGVMRRLAAPGEERDPWRVLALPAGLSTAALILDTAVSRLGVTQAGLQAVGTAVAVSLVLALAWLAFAFIGAVGDWLAARAQQTISFVDEIATSLATGLLKLIVVVTAVVWTADLIGLPYEGVLTALGAGGVAIAFAARDTVSNMMGGGILMADRPFTRGDLIELDGKLATVEQVGLRSTRLRALDDTMLNVPNAQLSDRVIANWGRRRRRKSAFAVGLTYDTPREKLDAFVTRLRAVVREQPTTDPADVYVGLSGFGASSIDIDVLCHFRVAAYDAQVEAQHALILDIIALAEEVGVEFAFPTRTVHVVASPEAASDENPTAKRGLTPQDAAQ